MLTYFYTKYKEELQLDLLEGLLWTSFFVTLRPDFCHRVSGGAIKKGKMWLIPDTVQKPADARYKKNKHNA